MALTMKEKYARVDLAKLPADLKKEFEGIKEDSENFDPELTPIFEDNFKDAYAIVENHFPEAIKKPGKIKKIRPSKVKRPVAKSKKDDFRTMISKATGIKDKNELASIHMKMLNTLDPDDEDATLTRLSDKEFNNLAKKFAGQSTSKKEMVHKSRGKKPTGLKGYTKSISEATGIIDPKVLDELEDIMRNDIFHSTLDWQTKEEFDKGAKEAVEVYNAIKGKTFVPRSRGKKKDVYEPGDVQIEACRKILGEAGYTLVKKPSKTGKRVMKVKKPRQERTIIKDKVDDTFKTILKDVSGSKEKDEKYQKMQKALSELQELMTRLFSLLNNLAEDNSIEKVEKIISLMKKLVP